MKSSHYSIWTDFEEQWDEHTVQNPKMRVEVGSPEEAAELFVGRYGCEPWEQVIVRNDQTGNFYRLQLQKTWNVESLESVTLEELCSP